MLGLCIDHVDVKGSGIPVRFRAKSMPNIQYIHLETAYTAVKSATATGQKVCGTVRVRKTWWCSGITRLQIKIVQLIVILNKARSLFDSGLGHVSVK
jgi:hypothetical protein